MTRDGTIPRVFISYSHDSPSHKRWVAELASELRRNGVDVVLDQWDLGLGADLTQFMEQGVAAADRVLLICTEPFVRKLDARTGGAGYEGSVVTGELIANQGSNKFIPVIRQTESARIKPVVFKARVHIDMSEDQPFAERLKELLHELHAVPVVPKPPIGRNPFGLAAVARDPSGHSVAGPAGGRAGLEGQSGPRIRRTFSDIERDRFLQESFEAIAGHFEKSVNEVIGEYPEIDGRFERIDRRQFAGRLYRSGKLAAQCRIRLGTSGFSSGTAITYLNQDSDSPSSCNESLSIGDDGYALHLRSMMNFGNFGGVESKKGLSPKEAAEGLWEMFIGPLQQ